MIKKILLSIGLIGLGLINFSYGYLSSYIEVNTNDGFTLNGNTFIIDEKLNFIDTKYVGYSNTCGYGRQPNLFFWADEGLAFYNSTNPSGILIYTGYCLTQYNSGDYGNLQSCNEILPFENLLNQNLTFKKVIFNGMTDYNGCMVWNYDGVPSNITFVDINGNAYIFPRAGGVRTNYSSFGYSLINTDINREDIINDYAIESSPFNGGGGSDIPISGGQSPITGGYTYMYCTNQNVLAYYVKTFGYNGNMCNLNSGGVVDGYYPYGTLLEFCNIYYTFYNIDGTFLNQLYTGHNKNIVCDSPKSYLTGYNPNSIDWSDTFPGVVNGSGEYEVQSSDSFLINLTNILKGNFYLPETGDFGLGYLPRYIILGFMGVIFFNFIRK